MIAGPCRPKRNGTFKTVARDWQRTGSTGSRRAGIPRSRAPRARQHLHAGQCTAVRCLCVHKPRSLGRPIVMRSDRAAPVDLRWMAPGGQGAEGAWVLIVFQPLAFGKAHTVSWGTVGSCWDGARPPVLRRVHTHGGLTLDASRRFVFSPAGPVQGWLTTTDHNRPTTPESRADCEPSRPRPLTTEQFARLAGPR